MKLSPPPIVCRIVPPVALTLAQLALLSPLFMEPTAPMTTRVFVVFGLTFGLGWVNLFVLDVVARRRL